MGLKGLKGFTGSAWVLVCSLIGSIVLSGCSSVPLFGERGSGQEFRPVNGRIGDLKHFEDWEKAPQGTAFYKDDGPGSHRPVGLEGMPDPQPRIEPIRQANTRPYTVMGLSFRPQKTLKEPYRQKGRASWYGRKFHGAKTANGEIYDMYQMSAAHPTLPLPSYARVTNLENNQQVIVRVNDRGPFLRGRIIDLSYAAAFRLGYVNQGSAKVLVEKLTPSLIAKLQAEQKDAGVELAQEPEAPAIQVAVANPVPSPIAPKIEAPVVFSADRPVLGDASQSKPVQEADLSAKAAPINSSAPVVRASVAGLLPDVGPPQMVGPAVDGNLFLQLGAFGSEDNANSMVTRIKADFPDLATLLKVIDGEKIFRVFAGPFATREAVNEAVISLSAFGGVRPVIREGLKLP